MEPFRAPYPPVRRISLVLAARPDREVLVYCACPNEASAAVVARRLKQAGIKSLPGGIDARVRAGQPLERPPTLEQRPAVSTSP